ncbi:fimbria/pilus outer membrane usher protein [Sulfurospirillum sp. 1612]|uniref:fimbria/pilus outer membrane usher protein n=1 Tax=Sulfurospirillum sp. 1612 TaxID=3094835 RepID=UPI002F95B4F3
MPNRWQSSPCYALLILLLMGVCPLLATESKHSSLFLPSLEKKGYQDSLFSITLNGQNTGDVFLVLMRDERLYLSQENLSTLRLVLPQNHRVQINHKSYIPLDAISGLTYTLDSAHLILHLRATPQCFIKSELTSKHTTSSKFSPASNGFFFNYDTSYEQTQDQKSGSLLGEVGIFGENGLVLGNFLLHNDEVNGEVTRDMVRLDTAYIFDLPAELQTLRVGDSISKSDTMWGNSVRFGGVQWGTNFAIQPDLITMPQFSISGEAKLPSTADLYINNIRKERFDIDQGPFTIPNIPTVSGAGQMQLVVKDILGRETVIQVPFYASPSLLQTGLAEYSSEIGFLRENYAIQSNDYGAFVAAGTYRRGITDGLTLGIHGEGTSQTQALGISSNILWSNIGIFSAFAAGSHSRENTSRVGSQGEQIGLGFDHSGSPASFGVRATFSTRGFTGVGEEDASRIRFDGRVSLHYATQHVGSFSGTLLHRNYWEEEDVRAVTLGYQLRLGKWGSFSATLQHTILPESDNVLFCYVSIPLGNRTSGSIHVRRDNGVLTESFALQKSLPSGTGSGYSVQGETGENERLEATYNYQNSHGSYHATVVRNEDQNAYRLGISGGIGYLDGSLFQARRIDQSFAIVDVGDFKGVDVYQDNQLVGKTDENGRAILPRLRAYQKNPIRIETKDLPMNVSIPLYKINAVPRYRQGIQVNFPIHHVRQAVMRFVTEEGSALPTGADIQIKGTSHHFPVGSNGEVYLTDLDAVSQIRACWDGHCCEATITYPKSDDPLPDLGEQICKEIGQ